MTGLSTGHPMGAGSGIVMRKRLACLFALSALCVPAFAIRSEDRISEEQIIAQLEQRAAKAPDRERCYMYAELVHEMVKYSADQYASGEVDRANSTLRHMQGVTGKIRSLVGTNAKKLKPAQILLRRAAYRLTDLIHVTSYEDRKLVEETLAMVQEAERDALNQVLRK